MVITITMTTQQVHETEFSRDVGCVKCCVASLAERVSDRRPPDVAVRHKVCQRRHIAIQILWSVCNLKVHVTARTLHIVPLRENFASEALRYGTHCRQISVLRAHCRFYP